GSGHPAAARSDGETCAVALRLPVGWPDRFPEDTPGALRAAAHAVEIGAGARFALAASRLHFCGGFDLEDPEILAEAAATAGIGLDDCLAAARDARLDLVPRATARGLAARGLGRLPVLRAGRCWFAGERALGEARALVART